MNSVTFTGHLTRDAEKRTTAQSNSTFTNISVASNFAFGAKADELKEKGQPTAIFYSVTAFGDYFANLVGDLQKGTLVMVQGDLSIGTYETESGETRTSFNVTARNIERFLPKAEDKEPWE